MEADPFLVATWPEPVRILGQELRPYCVGHEILLQRLANPFVDPDHPPDAENLAPALFLGVFICCHTFAEASTALRKPDFDGTIAAWRQQCGEFDLLPRAQAFRDYIDAGSRPPSVEITRRRGHRHDPSGAPWLCTLLATLTGRLHFSPSEAMECPYAMAQWLYAAHWEQQGSLRITTREDQMDAAIRRYAAAHGLELMKAGDLPSR